MIDATSAQLVLKSVFWQLKTKQATGNKTANDLRTFMVVATRFELVTPAV